MAEGGCGGGAPAAATLFRCALCRRTAFRGRRGHLHSAGHQRRLRAALARLGEKVAAARRALRGAALEPFEPARHLRPCWCLCCGREVAPHARWGRLAVLQGGLLRHLASPEHARATSAFWWENKADPTLKPRFLLSAQDYARFEASLTKALEAYEAKEEESIQEAAAQIRKVEQSRKEMVQACLEPQAEGKLCDGTAAAHNSLSGNLSDSAFSMEEQDRPGPSRSATSASEQPGTPWRTVSELDWLEAEQPLTFIGHQETSGKGNVHTGAQPPWLLEEEEESGRSQGQIGPSYEEFLKEKEKQKLMKLPPDRVGANFDHTSQTGEGWLPSFGRVWNHGRRWQSRHQFKAEAGQRKPGTKRKEAKC
ncbi:centrosomal AT-AC splicing factor [Tiliqua scincoides]|uniref:centrosomal AT-AC splicing factor n=1 Tax=Tiliqua scincoides TaxID=71010 RepID=UPI003462453D